MKTRIKELRQEKEFTQKFLAHQIGATQAALSKIERGTSIPDANLLIKLSDIFQVSTDYILCLSDYRDMNYHPSLNKFNTDQFCHLLNFVDSIFE